jgi:SAM-dependent methyltransferase
MLDLACRPTYPPLLADDLCDAAPDAPAPDAADDGGGTAMGRCVRALLLSLGLEAGQLVVDVGCGGGWLASQLAALPRLRYIGTDVSPDLLAHTRALAARDEWLFVCGDGDALPCAGNAADFVCLFSLFAHLLPDDAVRHLREAKRVLRPGGRVVFPFFDFVTPRPAIAAWARRAGLAVEQIADRHAAPFPAGQCVAVLSKPDLP